MKKVNGSNGYVVYAREAKTAGLNPGGLWKSLRDWPHVQLRPVSNPAKVMALTEIDRVMRERFGGLLGGRKFQGHDTQ